MCALHHPRGVLCAQAGHKVNFKEYPPPAELCSRNLSALCFALQSDGVQVQEFRSLFKYKHTECASIAPRAHAARKHAERLLLSVFGRVIHVNTSNTSEPSRMRGRKSA